MNKKLLVLMVVPILVAMGGTFAFSAFSGSSSIAVNGTAGHLDWQNNVHLVGTNANNTVITVEGPNGIITTIGQGADVHNSNGSYYLNLGTASYTTATSGGEYVINVTNFAPGEYVILKAVITNTGTVGMIVTDPPGPAPGPGPHTPMTNTTPPSPTMPSTGVSMYSYNNTTSSDKQYNPNGQPINATGVSETNFMSALQMDTGYVYNVTEGSGFGTSLSPGGTATMYIFLGLGNSNGQDVNYYQGSDISLNINLNVISDP